MDYCEANARYVFGNATGDPVAERIEAELETEPGGLSRTDLMQRSSSRVWIW